MLTTLFTGCASIGEVSEPGAAPSVAVPVPARTAAVAPAPTTPEAPKVFAAEKRRSTEAPRDTASAQAHADLWVRIRAGFAMPELDTALVAEKERFYTSRPEYLQRMFQRGERYLFYIVEELERRGLPTELALLPFVESAMNPSAVSSAQAAGLWQFIPSTGKQYNLHQNWWVDNRRDPVKSTHAALDYLQRIYAMHGNDWFLALASYNWGEGSVARAVRKNQLRGRPTDYLSLDMPAETRHYVPKLIALKHILQRADEFGIALPALPNRPYFVTLEKTRPIDLKLAAKFAGMTVAEFVALNPAHNRPVISASRNNQIKLPAERVDSFMAALERHEKADKPLATWQPYTLKPGENIEAVAERAGVQPEEILKANSLRESQRIVAGTRIIAPQKSVEDESRVESFVAPRVYEEISKPAQYHTVRTKESLAGIARSYGLTAATLTAWNDVKRGVRRGMRLLVQPAATQTLLTNEEGNRSIVATATRPGFVRVADVPETPQPAPTAAAEAPAKAAPARVVRTAGIAPRAPAPKATQHTRSSAKAAPASRVRVVARPAAAPKPKAEARATKASAPARAQVKSPSKQPARAATRDGKQPPRAEGSGRGRGA
ncbi:transglycosylase SLT domain-containing protein [Quisquiliibacterium transsilvanicum]|uniref:Membrane-bound lytic murein transglycosylase D n=1 Tax=Quisquiliibacterium transsilvanicum TaxID=1549638 RepID=A0A7W8M7K9_9BURK|nr:transglycosylase SLT domain-containing protein [Quisquiliibacterium transsilvanicum]MBB5271106.1 membrane-bound lytic murein transglycosylase D [Quisquiliibacterium transsilvanicum]